MSRVVFRNRLDLAGTPVSVAMGKGVITLQGRQYTMQRGVLVPVGATHMTGRAPAVNVVNPGSFAIASVSGTLNHNASVTLSGAQFGTKSPAGPIVYDDASGTSPLSTGWDEALPNAATSTYDMAYRTPASVSGGSSVALPHARNTKYACGCHRNSTATDGSNVTLDKFRTLSSHPGYTFLSWWERVDPAWVFGDDDNYKCYDWGNEQGGYDLPENWYLEYYHFTSGGHGDGDAGWHINPDDVSAGGPLDNPDSNGHNHFWDDASSPFSAWKKVELRIRWMTDNTGYIKLYDNGVLRVNYLGTTDGSGWTGTDRYDMLGGYARNRGVHQWRYYSDVYLDYSIAHVVIGNASTYSACTVREPQIPTSWSSSSIDITVKLGAHANGSSKWLYVTDSNGNTTPGFAVTLGS